MHLRLRSQPFCRLFCREIPLRVGQHLVPHHELLDGGGPQQWREVERVQLPVVVIDTEKFSKLALFRAGNESQVPDLDLASGPLGAP